MPLRVIPEGLEDHFKSKVTTTASCWKISRYDGEVFRFTDCDVSIELDDGTYVPIGSGNVSAIENTVEVESDNLSVTHILDTHQITVDDLNAGLFDGAKVEIFRVNYKDPDQGTITIFRGYFGEVKMRDDIDAEVELKSISTKLTQTIGRQYTQQCDADLGDERCGVDLAPYTVSGEIDAVVSKTKFRDAAREESESYFRYGVLEFTSGYNEGTRFEIKGFSSDIPIVVVDKVYNYFGLLGNELNEFSVGDTFEVYESTGNDGEYTIAAIAYENQLGSMKYDNGSYQIMMMSVYSIAIEGDPFNLGDDDEDTNEIGKGDSFNIEGSMSQDGSYTVLEASFDNESSRTTIHTQERVGRPHNVGITKITPEEYIPSSVADGKVNYGPNGIFELWLSPSFKVQVGDTYKAHAGCSRYLGSCMDFSNVINFRGFPHIPGRDEALRYPDANS